MTDKIKKEVVGKIPIRTELEILPADEPKQLKIGWTVKEYIGGEIFKLDANGQMITEPLTNKTDLIPGMIVAAPTLFGYVNTTIDVDQYGEVFGTSGGLYIMLSFGEDDRKCWVSSGAINMKAIKKLTKQKEIK